MAGWLAGYLCALGRPYRCHHYVRVSSLNRGRQSLQSQRRLVFWRIEKDWPAHWIHANVRRDLLILLAQQQRIDRLDSVASRLKRSSGPAADTPTDPASSCAPKEQQHAESIVGHPFDASTRLPPGATSARRGALPSPPGPSPPRSDARCRPVQRALRALLQPQSVARLPRAGRPAARGVYPHELHNY